MAKPGKWRTITPQLYAEIKAASHEVKHGRYKYNDRAVMQRFGIGKTTMQYIRNTRNYEDYCRRTDKNLVPQPPFENMAQRKYLTKNDELLDLDDAIRKSDRLDREAEHTAMAFGAMFLFAFLIGIIVLAIIFLSKLGSGDV